MPSVAPANPPAQPSARAVAVRVLSAVTGDGRALDDAWDQLPADLAPADQALVKEICFGVMRWYPRLESLLRLLVPKPLKAKDRDIRCSLLVGAYQLTAMRVPPHAAIHATVEVAREQRKPWARGLINASLRRLQRDGDALLAEVDRDPAARHAHPRWLLDAIQRAYPDDWAKVIAANNARPPMTLRVNRLTRTRAAYLADLDRAAIDAHPARFTDAGVTLTAALPTERVPGFDAGHVSVQDGAAQLCAGLLDLHPGQRVLDACAAPGGKTGQLLESEPGLVELVALDRVGRRLERLRDNLARLHLKATVVDGDATRPADWWDGRQFERILVDAPCSGTGVIRRHPDIKFLRRPTDIAPLAARQIELLGALWPLLAPGGLLLYATCSVLPAENEAVVQAFLDHHPDASQSPIGAAWGKPGSLDDAGGDPIGRRILPGDADMDGFFFARLRKAAGQ